MAKRKPIPGAEWSKDTFPDLEKAFMSQDPLPAVLMATNINEHCLMTLLETYFIPDPISTSLFSIGGDLESFSQCARMAYCLGLIPKIIFDNLYLIARARNIFAHSRSLVTFDTQDVRDLIDKMEIPEVGIVWFPDQLASKAAHWHYRTKFVCVANMCSSYVLKRAVQLDRDRLPNADRENKQSEEQKTLWKTVVEGLNLAYSQRHSESKVS